MIVASNTFLCVLPDRTIIKFVSVNFESVTASEISESGGVSKIIASYLSFNSFINLAFSSESISSEGFGGIGPDANISKFSKDVL